MASIDHLLARALLLKDPQVPADTVPYEDTAYPDFPPDGTPLGDSCSRDVRDDTAMRNLQALCEVAVNRSTPSQLTDFITEQLPAPRAAWILGCLLHLADAEEGARFWWQYAAGAGDDAAAYCLYLHCLALGDSYAAALWREQTSLDTPPHDFDDTSVPTVLRILSHLTPAANRRHSEATTAVIGYVAAAVAAGYARNPGYEIPLPGPDFARHIERILGTTPAAARAPRQRKQSATTLPNRPPLDSSTAGRPDEVRAEEPERVLMEVAAADAESASAFKEAFKEAMAACWDSVADLTGREMDQHGARLRYCLDRRPPLCPRHASRPRAAT
ncbi:DUF6207 family protein [Streptomyces violaceusniger]|uniref:Uncharacterized protein n=1 Tax=Streptomyces violaceusniger (strain Tu 4113) TaxID=653045 RepID=G2PGN8_STRV4|nr:DUF6207 family protein [Streptomyces violaceusniger]AEM88534.1 hypothetical protein Strvi_9246 [Streptomyces violaceusniger Tu 4113]